jgi:hypothetical protein
LVDTHGVQIAALNYPGLTSTFLFHSVEKFYKKFYFRPRKMLALGGGMLRDGEVMRRRLREGVEFFSFLYAHKNAPNSVDVAPALAGDTPASGSGD